MQPRELTALRHSPWPWKPSGGADAERARSVSAERQRAHAPPQLAQLGRLEVVKDDAAQKDVRVAVEAVADALDGDRVELRADVETLALARQERPVDGAGHHLHRRGVLVAIDAEKGLSLIH